ncbi:hypothetical protein CAPTEDRAFT_188577 [Capitella teleta]|uniref:Uncharacterized protein n=1 Tax=Capitella teleta TaxID=283909 RepID=R7UIS0_CAPTE|nr:hypothetical protein CAPTEDRAFT_188577 [Capitella teleta]|eukprot:ELU06050.1 hypothetical protein CAPTEDRAFT_188577 [Capitella teleta]
MGCSCVKPVAAAATWYSAADSRAADEYILQSNGFGKGRSKAFFKAISSKPGVNRKGNEFGQLGGKLIFFQSAKKNKDYSCSSPMPVIRLNKKRKLFAKAFVMCPLGRLPIGRNHFQFDKMNHPNQKGAVLLAVTPRIIALFMTVDGVAIKSEVLCHDSVDKLRKDYRDLKPKPEWLQTALPGSFFTYMPSRHQDEYFFIHLPLVAELEDTLLETGNYAADLITTFCELLSSLSPGPHEINVQVKGYHDHCDYNYFVLDKNVNAMGKWGCKLSNNRLLEPHPDPRKLYPITQVIASGSMKLIVPNTVIPLIKGLLEKKPPVERYKGDDKESIKKEAKIIAAGRFCHSFNLEGPPDVLVLSSDEMEQKNKDATGYVYSYNYIEFAAFWLNTEDPNPQKEGIAT